MADLLDPKNVPATDIEEAVTGAALGLFVGALLGLSLAPGTTSAFVGGLVATITAYFGLANTSVNTGTRPLMWRMVSFCLIGVVATIVGIYARTHELLSPTRSGTLTEITAELLELDYNEEDIRKMITSRYFPSSGGGATFELPPAGTRTGTLANDAPNQ